jgi:hypothetical protein
MAITRSQLVKELEPGLNALFGMEYKRYENEHEEIFSTETSDRAFEEELMLTGFGSAPVKTEGRWRWHTTPLWNRSPLATPTKPSLWRSR